MTMDTALMGRLRRLSDAAERLDLNGLDIQHAALCLRRAWLHRKRVSFAAANGHVRRGLALAAGHYARDRSAFGLNGLHPDRIDWEGRTIREDKASRSHVEASVLQALFYAALMSAATGAAWQAAVHVPAQRRRLVRQLDEAALDRLDRIVGRIAETETGACPPAEPQPVCSGCSANLLCRIAPEDQDA